MNPINNNDSGASIRAKLNILIDKAIQTEPLELHVGVNQKYATITAAVAEWSNPATINKAKTVVRIHKGIYNESITLYGTSNLSFIGDNKYDVIWETKTGYYPDAPLRIGGNVLIKGITFIASIEDNPGWSYTPYTSRNTGGAYAVHLGDPTAIGEVVIEDCDLTSHVSAALGSGTRINQQIKLIRSNLYSYATDAVTKLYGTWFYQTSTALNATGQKITAYNCYIYSEKYVAINAASYGDNTPVAMDFVGNTLISGTIALNIPSTQMLFLTPGVGATIIKTIVTPNSCGNNIEIMNSPDSSWQKAILTASNGLPIVVTDFNTPKSGYFMGNGLSGCINTPAPGWCFGYTESFSLTQYCVQYAWVAATGVKYKRTLGATVWTAWEKCFETITDINAYLAIGSTGYCLPISDLNNATKCGYYYCDGTAGTSNTPLSAAYNVHVIGFSAGYVTQYAYGLANGAKFKRVKSGTWGSWVAITEP